MIRNGFRISIEAPQEQRAGIEMGTFTQGKGDLELPAAHLEQTGIAKRSRSPATDDAQEAGVYGIWLSSRATSKLTVNVHLQRQESCEGALFHTRPLIPTEWPCCVLPFRYI